MACRDCVLFDTSGRGHEYDRDGLCRWRPKEPLPNPLMFNWVAPLMYENEGNDCPAFKERPHA